MGHERATRHRNGRAVLAAGLVLVLAACAGTGSLPGVTTVGAITIVGLEPNVLQCSVAIGDYISVQGTNFGTREQWEAGLFSVTFPPDPPGVAATDVQLADLQGVDTPQTLYVRVPTGAQSGTIVIDVGDNGLAQVPIQIDDGSTAALSPSMVHITRCPQISPPP